jgi:hypothetical protein
LKESEMQSKFILSAIATAVSFLLIPSQLDAYGACHVGYTHVGSNGVYHAGGTAAYGERGRYGGAYHAEYGEAHTSSSHYAGVTNDRGSHYAGMVSGSNRYAYVR